MSRCQVTPHVQGVAGRPMTFDFTGERMRTDEPGNAQGGGMRFWRILGCYVSVICTALVPGLLVVLLLYHLRISIPGCSICGAGKFAEVGQICSTIWP